MPVLEGFANTTLISSHVHPSRWKLAGACFDVALSSLSYRCFVMHEEDSQLLALDGRKLDAKTSRSGMGSRAPKRIWGLHIGLQSRFSRLMPSLTND